MKVINKKEVVVEEIEVSPGEYYFECQEGISHKMVLTDYDDGEGLDYFYEFIENYNNNYGIRVRKDTVFDGEEFPYKFSAFMRAISGKRLKKKSLRKKNKKYLKDYENTNFNLIHFIYFNNT
jgi:hypothetical protein